MLHEGPPRADGIGPRLTARAISYGIPVAAMALALLTACEPRLGPKDGEELPPTDLERVRVGDEAPDFTLQALSGEALTLSDYQGNQRVVLQFYRGHW